VVKRYERKPAQLAPHWWTHLCWAFDARLNKGAAEYGDESFDLPLLDLRTEILEELVDAVGWLFLAWCRVQSPRLKRAAAATRKRFLERVRIRLQTGAWTQHEPDPAREVERLAALAACQWASMRQDLEGLMSAVRDIEFARCPKSQPPAGDAYIGRRGGLSE
jgi:hypothetical protein